MVCVPATPSLKKLHEEFKIICRIHDIQHVSYICAIRGVISLVKETVLPHIEHHLTETGRHHHEICTRIHIIRRLLDDWVFPVPPWYYVMILNETLPMETPTNLEVFACERAVPHTYYTL